MTKTLRGIKYEERIIDGHLFWFIDIRNPFLRDGRYWFSLNDKIFKLGRIRGVAKLIVTVGHKEVMIPILTPKELKHKEVRNEVERIPSKFENGSPWKRYLFAI